MRQRQSELVLRQLQRWMGERRTEELPDGQLLQRFVDDRDEAAFETLVLRHGPMVLRVCRRVLRHSHDAEDAFQATFLVLARRAGTIRKQASVGSWLHGVAYRIAVRASAARSRAGREPLGDDPARSDLLTDVLWRELQAVLDEELTRLPEQERAPLVLCYLEGRSQEEAARQLGWTRGALRRRLDRGREMLYARLVRRGVQVTAPMVVAALVHDATASALPAALVRMAVQAAPLTAGGTGALAGVVSSRAAQLAGWASRACWLAKLKAGAAVVLLCALAVGTGVAIRLTPVAVPAPDERDAVATVSAQEPEAPDEPAVEEGDRDQEPLPAGALARLGTSHFRHGHNVMAVAYSPDGKSLASAGWDATVRLWELASGREIRAFAEPGARSDPFTPSRWVYCLAFSPDGSTLAAGDHADNWQLHTIRLWDVATGQLRHKIQGHEQGVLSVAFTPDGKTLASVSADQTLRLWDVASGRQLRTCAGGHGPVRSVACSPDGRTLVSGGADRTVRLWDLAGGQELCRFLGHQGEVEAVAYSPDGRYVASAGQDRTIRVWDLAAGKQLLRLAGHQQAIRGLAFSPDGKTLASGGWDRTVRLWDLAGGKELARFRGHHDGVQSVAFAPDGKTLASAAADQTVRLWDVSGRGPGPQWSHESVVTALHFAADGKTLVSAARDRTIRRWDWRQGRLIHRFPGGQSRDRAVAFSPDGATIATGTAEGTICLWEASSGQERNRFVAHRTGVNAVAFSPDGHTLVSGGADGTIRLWSTATGEECGRLPTQPVAVLHVAFAPDGRTLLVETADSSIALWDVVMGRRLCGWRTNGGVTGSAVFSPDGKLVARGGWYGTVHLHDVSDGREVGTLVGQAGWVSSLAFSPDGTRLAAGSWMEIRVWDVATGRSDRRFTLPQGDVMSLAFSPDGRVLASGGGDTAIWVWDLTKTTAQEVPIRHP